VFVACDLLHLNGHDLRRMHLVERRAILEDLVPDEGAIQFSHAHEGDAALSLLKSAGWAWKAWSRSRRTASIAPVHPRRG
jgi:bifunctional non-homologous end joining protein LigD